MTLPSPCAPSPPRFSQLAMGQTVNKLAAKIGVVRIDKDKQKEELDGLIKVYLDEHYKDFQEKKTTSLPDFSHAVFEIVEKLGEKSGAMQFKIPSNNKLEEAFKAVHNDTTKELTPEELRKIISRIITLDSLYVGQGARDIFLHIFGIPIVALLAKRMLPGPTSYIADEVFIPAVTSGTVVFLAKTNRI